MLSAQGKRRTDISIEGKNITLSDRAFISAQTPLANGDAGPVTIRSKPNILLLNNSEISTNIGPKAIGASSDINIVTQTLELKNRSQLTTSTFGHGNSGAVMINATSTTLRIKVKLTLKLAQMRLDAQRECKITADQLSLSNESQLLTQTLGQGDAGLIQLKTGSVLLKNGSGFVADTQGNGNGGSILD